MAVERRGFSPLLQDITIKSDKPSVHKKQVTEFYAFSKPKNERNQKYKKKKKSFTLLKTAGAGWSFLLLVFKRQTEGTKGSCSVFHEGDVIWQKPLCVMKGTAPVAQHLLSSLNLFKDQERRETYK